MLTAEGVVVRREHASSGVTEEKPEDATPKWRVLLRQRTRRLRTPALPTWHHGSTWSLASRDEPLTLTHRTESNHLDPQTEASMTTWAPPGLLGGDLGRCSNAGSPRRTVRSASPTGGAAPAPWPA